MNEISHEKREWKTPDLVDLSTLEQTAVDQKSQAGTTECGTYYVNTSADPNRCPT